MSSNNQIPILRNIAKTDQKLLLQTLHFFTEENTCRLQEWGMVFSLHVCERSATSVKVGM